MQHQTLLLPLFYLPPIEFFSLLLNSKEILIEQHEHYVKQTYRNRCHILGANGTVPLSIPVQHGKKEHTKFKEMKISYADNWQKLHWKSIESAYRSSPYFEYYEDQFKGFYHNQYEFLFDFNLELIKVVLQILDIQKELKFTKSYEEDYSNNYVDQRDSLHPKKESDHKIIPYTQVFSSKFDFIPNLSIIDLLYNEGPNAINFLKHTED
ncbi:MAG: hypothetical protein COC01_06315 [Bacteroidetes bacterium]|nr:MAG: hypothetical protein COC01_06315 [Bacteroidota bacterium]